MFTIATATVTNSINNTTVGEFLVLLIALGTVTTMIIKISNHVNELKREIERINDKLRSKTEKLNYKINTLAITARDKQDLNSSRLDDVENYLAKNHNFNIRQNNPKTHSGANFLENLENIDIDI